MTEPTPLQQLEEAINTAIGMRERDQMDLLNETIRNGPAKTKELSDKSRVMFKAAIITACKAYALAIAGEDETNLGELIPVEFVAAVICNDLRAQLRREIEGK